MTSPRNQSLRRVAALALLAALLASAPAGATSTTIQIPGLHTTVTTHAPVLARPRSATATRLSELLRELRERRAAKAHAGAGATGSPTATATTPTTTYVPTSSATTPGVAKTGLAPAAPGTQTAAPTQAPVKAPAPSAKASGDRPLSSGAIVVAALAALLVLACLAWAFARSLAFEPHWLVTLRHATAEAGFRASATWSEFLDWARLGH